MRAVNYIFQQTFHEEAMIWKNLKHPNILPLLGVTVDPLQLILDCSDGTPGGTLPQYIKLNPDADRLQLVGISPYVSLTFLSHC